MAISMGGFGWNFISDVSCVCKVLQAVNTDITSVCSFKSEHGTGRFTLEGYYFSSVSLIYTKIRHQILI